MDNCPLCRRRKGKRACPALGESVCPHCCGTKRTVVVDCPGDCAYFDGTRARGWVHRRGEFVRDMTELGPYIDSLTRAGSHLFQALLHETVELVRAAPDTDDELLLDAVRSLRKTLATSTTGLLYEHPPEDARAVPLLRRLGAYFGLRGEDEGGSAPDPRDSASVLEALEAALEAARRSGEGPSSFIRRAGRVAARFPLSAPPKGGARLVTL